MQIAIDARLEVQGVYGDGWHEGIERTRGRAILNGPRESQLPATKYDTLAEEERRALAKVDRYAFGLLGVGVRHADGSIVMGSSIKR